MNRKRVALTVLIDLDPVYGFGHETEDWQRYLQAHLLGTVGHYNPVVVINEGEES